MDYRAKVRNENISFSDLLFSSIWFSDVVEENNKQFNIFERD